ncbi:hypothetical protein [Ciceribacter sp. L1K22]|uniref:hypothetical protein n=1 Tax=Ciceribacter sp. L1K22 TaxID=2820275 RepID=UPI001ABDD77C|nr:hypothetical protein [Ciceribacter sp. L1K22]MBO3759667.1 hypothetical protein [Ciceribacter sp. L1K22]
MFDRSVFINCPFDEDYAPILQAIAFCVIYLGFSPRLAPQNADNAANRLSRIEEIIRTSKYGIHDLSRCKASSIGEFARMNMPFELGVDYGCKRFGTGQLANKSLLVLEESRYDYQRTLSDIAGWDLEAHAADYQQAIRKVRGWLIRQAAAPNFGATLIESKYVVFQQWYWMRELAAGASDDDIRQYPTVDVIDAMQEWMQAGQPA